LCGMNGQNCLHHIHGRVTSSPYNACPLHNFECHIGNGKLSADVTKKMLSLKMKEYLKSINYQDTLEDKKFLKAYKKYYG